MRFQSSRYMTRGISTQIPIATQLRIWGLIEMIPVPADYLQIFCLEGSDGIQRITHEQEEPVYHNEISFPCDNPVNAKIYVIDDETHCTMLLAEEY